MFERLAGWCAAQVEIGWLATVLAVPIYFNVDDVRAFEPDKAILLRDCSAILLALALLSLTLRLLGTALLASRRADARHPAPNGGALLPYVRRPAELGRWLLETLRR